MNKIDNSQTQLVAGGEIKHATTMLSLTTLGMGCGLLYGLYLPPHSSLNNAAGEIFSKVINIGLHSFSGAMIGFVSGIGLVAID